MAHSSPFPSLFVRVMMQDTIRPSYLLAPGRLEQVTLVP